MGVFHQTCMVTCMSIKTGMCSWLHAVSLRRAASGRTTKACRGSSEVVDKSCHVRSQLNRSRDAPLRPRRDWGHHHHLGLQIRRPRLSLPSRSSPDRALIGRGRAGLTAPEAAVWTETSLRLALNVDAVPAKLKVAMGVGPHGLGLAPAHHGLLTALWVWASSASRASPISTKN